MKGRTGLGYVEMWKAFSQRAFLLSDKEKS